MTRRLPCLIVTAALMLGGCQTSVSNKPDPLGQNVVESANLNYLLLSAGDPEEGVAYFEGALANEPERADLRRGLAISLARAKRYPEAARIYQELISLGQDDPADRLEYAFVTARLDKWEDVRTLMAGLPPGLNTARRHLAEAILHDHDRNWAEADAAYARAEQLTTNPASVLNNWGVSRMSRGDLPEAAATFERALSFNARLFNAKNNLAIARGLQGNYQLPIVPMTAREKAMILNNLGLIALRRGDDRIARGLFAGAVEAHPQHYDAAANRLAALEAAVEN